MALYDFRSLVAQAIQARGGLVDPAQYPVQHLSTATTFGTLTIKPQGARGPFLGFGITTGRQASTPPQSKIEIAVGETRKITLQPTYRETVCHSTAVTRGIVFSRWPAPLFVGSGKSVTLSETLIDPAGGNLANIAYFLAGFHTDQKSAEWAREVFGELRTFSFDIACDAATENGNGKNPYVFAEALDLVEWCVNNIDSAAGDLDFIRADLEGNNLFIANRVSGTLAVQLPQLMGYPSQYLGRHAEPGHTLNVQERIATGTRTDVWSVLAINGRQGEAAA